jgi:hypothetical protein
MFSVFGNECRPTSKQCGTGGFDGNGRKMSFDAASEIIGAEGM